MSQALFFLGLLQGKSTDNYLDITLIDVDSGTLNKYNTQKYRHYYPQFCILNLPLDHLPQS